MYGFIYLRVIKVREDRRVSSLQIETILLCLSISLVVLNVASTFLLQNTVCPKCQSLYKSFDSFNIVSILDSQMVESDNTLY